MEGTLLKAKGTAILQVHLRNTAGIPRRKEGTVLRPSNISVALRRVDGALLKDHLRDSSVDHHLIKAAMAALRKEGSLNSNIINMALLPLNLLLAIFPAQQRRVMPPETPMHSVMQ